MFHPSGLVDKDYLQENAAPSIVPNTIVIYTLLGAVISLTDLTEVYENTVSGDLVTVNPGTYNIGNNSIQLKDGVNWNFIGVPTISSDSANGTFIDAGIAVDVNFNGKLVIVNTNLFYNRINLTTNDSEVHGFTLKYYIDFIVSSAGVEIISTNVNELGFPAPIPTWVSKAILTFPVNVKTNLYYSSRFRAKVLGSYSGFYTYLLQDDATLLFSRPSFPSQSVLNIVFTNILTGALHTVLSDEFSASLLLEQIFDKAH